MPLDPRVWEGRGERRSGSQKTIRGDTTWAYCPLHEDGNHHRALHRLTLFKRTQHPMIDLILGGSRSGKSAAAVRLAAAGAGPVTYLATAVVSADDPSFAQRIDRHRTRRPADWTTVETGPDLAPHLARASGIVLVDSLGTWVAGHHDFIVDLDAFLAVLTARAGHTILVSDEVGLGVHPSSALGGRFRDALGLVNEAVSAVSDRVSFVIAGRVVGLERIPW